MRIDTTKITDWQVATKNRPILTKHLVSIIPDRTIVEKLLLDTLEGKEPLGLRDDAMICLGEAGDVWQQSANKLLKKYKIISIDENAWMTCEPLPDNAVNVVEVNQDIIDKFCLIEPNDGWWGSFTIIGQWGETIEGEMDVQKGCRGDFICQNQTDPTDVWIVKRQLFLNTYSLKV